MKKNHIILLALSLFTITAKAQVSYGAKAGVDLATEHFTSSDFSSSTYTTFNGGIFVNYKTALPIAVQLEVLYSGEGTKEKGTNANSSGRIKEAYLNIPLLAQYKVPVGVYIETGPQLGFLLSSKESYGTVTDQNIKQYYKSTDFSWCFGAGYEMLTGPVKGLGLNARYALGLTSIDKEENGVSGGNLKNRVFSIDLTYRLPVIGKGKR